MARWGRQAAMAGFSAAIFAGVAWLGQIPLGEAGGDAVIRLSLRATRARAEICRDRTAAELEALPQHMRQAEVCEEIAPAYRLELDIGGERVLEERVEPGGLRGDRPLIVDRQVAVEPGLRSVAVAFTPLLEPDPGQALAQASAELPSYRLRRELALQPDRITLITLDDASGELTIFGGR